MLFIITLFVLQGAAVAAALNCDRNATCAPGTYLLADGDCTECPAGSFSTGGSLLYDFSNLADMPFVHGCLYSPAYAGGSTCELTPGGWSVVVPLDDGYPYLDSGNYNEINAIVSSLIIGADLVVDGAVTFDFTVEAEKGGDGLTFEVDGGRLLNLQSIVAASTTLTFPLAPGMHYLTWKYSKDLSVTVYPDRAQITRILIDGTCTYSDSCSPCPPGYDTDSLAGAALCSPCPENTFSLGGWGSCLPCDPGYYAPNGSSTCFFRPPCTVDADMAMIYSPCHVSNITGTAVRTITYEYILPLICDPNNNQSEPAPLPTDVACEDCPPGTTREVDVDPAICQACPPGFSRAEGDAECARCPAGTSAIPKTIIQDFYPDVVDYYFTRTCSSPPSAPTECEAGGWLAMNDYLTTGTTHGVVTLSLTLSDPLSFPDSSGGEVMFLWDTTCTHNDNNGDSVANLDCQFAFFIDNVEEPTVRAVYNSTGNSASFFVTQGTHTFAWVFYKVSSAAVSNHGTVLHSVVFTGATSSTSGADTCSPCNDGYYNDGSLPQAFCSGCPAGTTSATSHTGCVNCPANTFAPQPGMATCLPCGEGTSASPNAVECDYNDCAFTVSLTGGETVVYDLFPLSRGVGEWGPLSDASRPSFAYFLNLCNRQQTNSICNVNNDTIKTLACQVVDGDAIDIGHIMGFSSLPAADANVGLQVVYSDGSSCTDSDYDGQNISRSTTLTINCDSMEVLGLFSPVTEIAPCIYSLSLQSQYGCYLCTSNDFEALPGVCDQSQLTQVISYRWKEPRVCARGVALPADQTVGCQPDESGGGAKNKSDGINDAGIASIAALSGLVVLLVGVLIVQKRKEGTLGGYVAMR